MRPARTGPGHHPIDGDNIFMDVMTLTTTPAAQKRAEMHQEYIAPIC